MQNSGFSSVVAILNAQNDSKVNLLDSVFADATTDSCRVLRYSVRCQWNLIFYYHRCLLQWWGIAFVPGSPAGDWWHNRGVEADGSCFKIDIPFSNRLHQRTGYQSCEREKWSSDPFDQRTGYQSCKWQMHHHPRLTSEQDISPVSGETSRQTRFTSRCVIATSGCRA